jgi:hypothetical protein
MTSMTTPSTAPQGSKAPSSSIVGRLRLVLADLVRPELDPVASRVTNALVGIGLRSNLRVADDDSRVSVVNPRIPLLITPETW